VLLLLCVRGQAEHGPDSQVVLVVIGMDADVAAISEEVQRQLALLPRGSIAAKALDHSYAVTTDSVEEVRKNVLRNKTKTKLSTVIPLFCLRSGEH